MADGDKRIGNKTATGEVEGSGADIRIVCGFRPAVVMVHNVDGEALLFWNRSLPDAYGYKSLGISSGINATENAHTHAAGAITITPDAVSAGTPAGTVAAPTGTNADSAVSLSASVVSASYLADMAIVEPVIALTHNADPVTNLAANPLYVVEAMVGASENCGSLQSTCDSAANVLGETADGSVLGAAGSARFFVTHSAAPAGVQIYVNEAATDQLECVSPTGKDVVVMMPMENAAGLGSAFVKVLIHHSDSAATGSPLYFDDNGAADAQLCFVDAGAVGGAIPATDIIPCQDGSTPLASGGFGSAAAQVGTAAAQVWTSGAAPVFTGAAMAPHQHADTAAGATSGAGSAHTHVFTGGATENVLITSLGVTPYWDGFNIGADTDVNVAAETIYWTAWGF